LRSGAFIIARNAGRGIVTDLEGRVHDRRLVEHRATVRIYFDLE